MRRLSIALLAALLSIVAPASALWMAAGSGTASASVLTMPTGETPSASASGFDVTVSWTQSSVVGQRLGALARGGYAVERFAAGSTTAQAPSGSCATTVRGGAETLSCVDSGVPAGSWEYRITPLLGTFTGTRSAASAAVTIVATPDAPASITATPMRNARIAVSWPAASGASGYNVYRRTAAGSFPATPLNGSTPLTSTSTTDTTAADGTSYVYSVRSTATGSGGVPLESASGPSSSAVTADGTAPGVVSSLAVTNGRLQSTAICGYAANTRFLSSTAASALAVTVTIASPESGERVLFTVSAGATSVTREVAASGSSVSTTLDASTLADGTLTVGAQTLDALGNTSATTTVTAVKDTVTPTTASFVYTKAVTGGSSANDTLTGSSECGATVTSIAYLRNGVTHTASTTLTAAGPFSLDLEPLGVTVNRYDVTVADLAANTSPVVSYTP